MRTGLSLAVSVGVGVAGAALVAEAQPRELGPHQHGHGTLNIATEGARVTMELDVPGVDIVGFEHAATTTAQRAAVETAKIQLADPLALFAFPKAAGCRVSVANVKIEGAESKQAKATTESQHSDFNADYVLECSSVDKLTSIEFLYFRKFSGAEELEVNLVTAKGQNKFIVKRSKPRIDLRGLM